MSAAPVDEEAPDNLPMVRAEAVSHHPTESMIDGPDPERAMAYARRLASNLRQLVEGATTPMGRDRDGKVREHINIEGWQSLAAATGHTCEIEWSRPVEQIAVSDKGVYAWEARAIVRDQHGNIVAAAESMADPGEKNARGNPPPWTGNNYSVRGMASTRAQSRALASRMRYVVRLGGMEGTPAEEMPETAQAEAVDPKKLAAERWRMCKELPVDQAQLTAALNGNTAVVLAEDEQLIAFVWRLASIASADADEAERSTEEPLEGEITHEGNDDNEKGD